MSTVLIWAGVLVAAFATVRLLLTRDRFLRLHFISAGSAVAAPLVTAGLALAPWSSWHDVAKVVLTGLLLVVTGPATVIATARASRRGSRG
ncbi:MAG TPA: monovalent cation/H(+) antiporter subunit G [Actinoallomurus sp.]|nr:monovalent cation/H(+) antiporter subunit G [Actinoallomurus sp.]